jgi:hypothetical protein
MAYPGSKLFETAKPGDLPKNWSGYSQHSFDTKPLPTEILLSEEILRFRDHAFTEYFSDEAYLERIYDKFGAVAMNHMIDMTTHHLSRAS